MLDLLKTEPLLQFAGMMGYDPHLAKIPDLPELRASATAQAQARYADFQAQALRSLPGAQREALVWNAAGSPTFHLHNGAGAANEVVIGSAFVKPSDFDLPHLVQLQPAAFIATPVLKSGGVRLPQGVEAVSTLARWWNPNQRQGYFIYGGQWLADPVSPAGLAHSGLYGHSSNQDLCLGSSAQQLQPGDTVFFRPRQSEAVLQQFGDLAVVDGQRLQTRWSVLPPMS